MDETTLREALRDLAENAESPQMSPERVRAKGNRRRAVRRSSFVTLCIALMISMGFGAIWMMRYTPKHSINATQPRTTTTAPTRLPTPTSQKTPTGPCSLVFSEIGANQPDRIVESRKKGETLEYVGKLANGNDVIISAFYADRQDASAQSIGGTRELLIATDAGMESIKTFSHNIDVHAWVVSGSDVVMWTAVRSKPIPTGPWTLGIWTPTQGSKDIATIDNPILIDRMVVGDRVFWTEMSEQDAVEIWSVPIAGGAAPSRLLATSEVAGFASKKVLLFEQASGWTWVDPISGNRSQSELAWPAPPTGARTLTATVDYFAMMGTSETKVFSLRPDSTLSYTPLPEFPKLEMQAAGGNFVVQSEGWVGVYDPHGKALAYVPIKEKGKLGYLGEARNMMYITTGAYVNNRTDFGAYLWLRVSRLEIFSTRFVDAQTHC